MYSGEPAAHLLHLKLKTESCWFVLTLQSACSAQHSLLLLVCTIAAYCRQAAARGSTGICVPPGFIYERRSPSSSFNWSRTGPHQLAPNQEDGSFQSFSGVSLNGLAMFVFKVLASKELPDRRSEVPKHLQPI